MHGVLFFRERATSDGGRGAVVLGGLDEGQVSAIHTAGPEPEHGAAHPGHGPKVKIPQK